MKKFEAGDTNGGLSRYMVVCIFVSIVDKYTNKSIEIVTLPLLRKRETKSSLDLCLVLYLCRLVICSIGKDDVNASLFDSLSLPGDMLSYYLNIKTLNTDYETQELHGDLQYREDFYTTILVLLNAECLRAGCS